MNRRERRRLEREGKLLKAEPTLNIKPSELAQAAVKGPGREAMLKEVRAQLLDMDKKYALDLDATVLWTLHTKYGFGPKRLKQFYFDMFKEHHRMREFYEMDDTYPERFKMKEKGIDVEAWFDALFDDKGNYRKPEEVTLP